MPRDTERPDRTRPVTDRDDGVFVRRHPPRKGLPAWGWMAIGGAVVGAMVVVWVAAQWGFDRQALAAHKEYRGLIEEATRRHRNCMELVDSEGQLRMLHMEFDAGTPQREKAAKKLAEIDAVLKAEQAKIMKLYADSDPLRRRWELTWLRLGLEVEPNKLAELTP